MIVVNVEPPVTASFGAGADSTPAILALKLLVIPCVGFAVVGYELGAEAVFLPALTGAVTDAMRTCSQELFSADFAARICVRVLIGPTPSLVLGTAFGSLLANAILVAVAAEELLAAQLAARVSVRVRGQPRAPVSFGVAPTRPVANSVLRFRRLTA